MRDRAPVAWLLLLLAAGRDAQAHHPVAETFSGHAQPVTMAGADVEVAGFDLAGASGHYLTLGARGDYAILPWLAVGARVPVHHLRLAGDDPVTGLGDIDLVLKVRFFASESAVLSAGLGVELPTGSEHDGLGSGHVELSPFVSGAAHAGGWMLHGTVGDSISIEGDSDHEHVVYIHPHSSHELRYHLGVARGFGGQLLANLVVSGATVLASEDRGATLLVLAPQLAWRPAAAWRFLVSVELPVTAERRFDWRAIASAQYLF